MLKTIRLLIGAAVLPALTVGALTTASAQVLPPVDTPIGGAGRDNAPLNPGGSELLPGAGQLTPGPLTTISPLTTGTPRPGTGALQETATPVGTMMPGGTMGPRTSGSPGPLTPGMAGTPGPMLTATPSAVTSGTQDIMTLTATLTGAAEVPGPGDEDGLGSAAIVIDPTRQMVCFALHAVNIEPATAAHIHEGAVDFAGPVVVPLEAPSGSNAYGCARDVERAVMSRLMQDPASFYVNVHNAVFPEGAVRGQLGR